MTSLKRIDEELEISEQSSFSEEASTSNKDQSKSLQ
jgi:hypothetical protein